MSEEEILEKVIKRNKFIIECAGNNLQPIDLQLQEETQAIENLIQENKKLLTELQENKCIKDIFKQLYIPKSKVKEKIEEYNIPILDVLEKLPLMPQTIERGCGAKDGIIYVLQELLEEGE